MTHAPRSLHELPMTAVEKGDYRVIIETPARLVVGFDSHKFGAVTNAAIEAGLA